MTDASSSPAAIEIWTDGACKGNPGPGGWATIATAINAEGQRVEIARASGGSPDTTNNMMELDAALAALRLAKANGWDAITVCTDSQYVVNGITQWLPGWKAKGWVNSDKKPVKNRDRWEALDSLNDPSRVSWRHVRGHRGIKWNELADQAANAAIVYPDGSAFGFVDEGEGFTA